MIPVLSVILMIAGLLVSVTFTPQEVPWIPLAAWPPAYASLAYWVGRDVVGHESKEERHRDGLRLVPHGLVFGLLVAAATMALRLIAHDSFALRMARLTATVAAFSMLWLYARRAAKWTAGEATAAAVFGGLPVLSAGGLLENLADY